MVERSATIAIRAAQPAALAANAPRLNIKNAGKQEGDARLLDGVFDGGFAGVLFVADRSSAGGVCSISHAQCS
jgi:hypothetical protein